MKWFGVFLLSWFITFAGGAAVLERTMKGLDVPTDGLVASVFLVMLLLGPFSGSLVFTLWLRRHLTQKPEPWLEPPFRFPGDDERDAQIASRIGRMTRWSTIVGGSLGLIGAGVLFLFANPKEGDIRAVLAMPITMGGAGGFFALALSCLFAPDSFLLGEVGRPYLEKIGTRNLTIARAACLMVIVVVGVPLMGLAVLILIVAIG